MNEQIQKYSEGFITALFDWLPSAAIAIIILIVGMFVVKKLSKLILLSMSKFKIEPEIRDFLFSLIEIMLKGIVVLSAASFLGFQMSALVGLLAGAVFAIGLALQGFMGNFASGLTIIFFKPYKVGDWVEISEKFGKIESIQIFNTLMSTPSNKKLVVPNGKVTDSIITNFSEMGYIRLELEILVSYEESTTKIKEVILEALKGSKYIIHDNPILMGIESYDTHNVQMAIRPSIDPDMYWEAIFECNSLIKNALSASGIKMAYSEGIDLGPIGPG